METCESNSKIERSSHASPSINPRSCKLNAELKGYRTDHRLLLTGTPLQASGWCGWAEGMVDAHCSRRRHVCRYIATLLLACRHARQFAA